MNDLWTFCYVGADSTLYTSNQNELEWEKINLPHTWNKKDCFDEKGGYKRGIGWYHKKLSVKGFSKVKKFFLYFEGANQISDVYLNGSHIGRHVGGYTAFCYDITDQIRFDENNLLAVRVDNRYNKHVPPLSGDFNFYGGIYRDVYLIVTNPIHFTLEDYASTGIYIKPSFASANQAFVHTSGTIVNSTNASTRLLLENDIYDPLNIKIGSFSKSIRLNANSTNEFRQRSMPVLKPALWTPDLPSLYRLVTKLYKDGELVDWLEIPFGFRWFYFDPEYGFYLNDQPIRLFGTNRHQDRAGYGNAVPNWVHESDLRYIKEMGGNFVRTAHYPQDPYFLHCADKMGVILWEEIPIVNEITQDVRFYQNCKTMLKEMIRQHYNHPSVMIWGYMNEVLLRGPQKTDSYIDSVVQLARELEMICTREDSTRVTAMAMHNSESYNTTGLADITDLVGWNLYHGWYYDTIQDFGRFLDQEHRDHPNRKIIVSEYGAGSDSRLHTFSPKAQDFTVEYQQLFHEQYLTQFASRSFIAGSAIWCQFDFGSSQRNNTKPHINQKGLIDFNRNPKDIYYFYKAKLSDKVILYIATREWKKRTGSNRYNKKIQGIQPVHQPVKVYTNLERVELFVNGLSLGEKRVDSFRCWETWQVPFMDGLNLIEARGNLDETAIWDRVEVEFSYQPPKLNDSTFSFKELAVNVGSHSQFISPSGLVWQGDQEYRSGVWGFVDGTAATTSKDILSTDMDPIYQTARIDLSEYRFDVPDGLYKIDFHFALFKDLSDSTHSTNITINGQSVFNQLDLTEIIGTNQAFSRAAFINTTKSNGLLIRFFAKEGKSILNGIHVKKY